MTSTDNSAHLLFEGLPSEAFSILMIGHIMSRTLYVNILVILNDAYSDAAHKCPGSFQAKSYSSYSNHICKLKQNKASQNREGAAKEEKAPFWSE